MTLPADGLVGSGDDGRPVDSHTASWGQWPAVTTPTLSCGKKIAVTLRADGSVSVDDDGRGIPFAKNIAEGEGAARCVALTRQGRRVRHRHTSDRLVIHLVIKGSVMDAWPVQDAKARFSELLDRCLAEGPQMVTRRGEEAAVLVRVDDWRRLRAAARPSLKQLLLSDGARAAITIPERGRARRRDVSTPD
ncbi:MAG: type II toxin-antitoxin system prevent-host-death family antitoxin [Rubrivivax sp.]